MVGTRGQIEPVGAHRVYSEVDRRSLLEECSRTTPSRRLCLASLHDIYCYSIPTGTQVPIVYNNTEK